MGQGAGSEEEGAMTSAEKKRWSAPKLMVFIRSTEEERAIVGCKLLSGSFGPNNLNSRCLRVTCTPSFPCSTITSS